MKSTIDAAGRVVIPNETAWMLDTWGDEILEMLTGAEGETRVTALLGPKK